MISTISINRPLVTRRITDLAPRQRNARTHSKKQIRQIARSIETFGFNNPVLVDSESRIVAGHGRVRAATLLGMERVPTICLDHLTEDEVRAYVIADNKLAENAGWDEATLAIEFDYLSELDFDVTITGFEAAEIDMLIEGPAPDEDAAGEPLPETDPGAVPVSRPGDLWQLGKHRLLCGDAGDPDALGHLMAGEVAQMVFIDPPYNVPIAGHVCGSGSIQHDEFAMASGEMDETAFAEFLQAAFANLAAHSVDGSIHFVCMDWRHIGELLAASRAIYTELKNLCIWNKDNGGMGSLYRSKHELVFVFKNGTAAHINNVALGAYGRYRTNVWDYPGVNTLRDGRLDDLAMHPTVKPLNLVADAIKDCSHRGGIILDSFAGSGTTLIAADRTGRVGRALEIDPAYVDTAIRRWQSTTGEAARLVGSDLTFDDIAEASDRAAKGRSDDKPLPPVDLTASTREAAYV